MDSGKGSEVPDDDDPRVMPVGATSSYDFRLPTRPDFAAIGAAAAADAAGDRLRAILRRAGDRGAHVTIDMEQYEKKGLTLEIVRAVLGEDEFRGRADVGIVLQAYLRDTERDLEELLYWLAWRGAPVLVRLVNVRRAE